MAANNLSYSLKVCLTTAIISPCLTVLADSVLFNMACQSVVQALSTALIAGCLLSVPIGICFYLLTRYVNKERFFYLKKKRILSISAVLLVFFPVLVVLLINSDFFVSFTVFDLMQPLAYALVFVIAILLYRLIPAEEESLFYGDYKD